MDRIGRISRIIPYIQLFNRCDWTALDRGMAELPSAVANALAQVEDQGHRSRTRRSLIEEDLERIHSRHRPSQLDRAKMVDLGHTNGDALSAAAEAYA